MTGRSYREEAVNPSMDLVALVRARRIRWMGHMLREEEGYLLKKVVVGYVKDKAEGGYSAGCILVEVRMALARTRFRTMYHIWDSKILSLEVKLQIYDSEVLSMLVYRCEAWLLVESMIRSLNGWNSRCLHLMTGRSYREETVEPSVDLVALVRARRLRLLGHVPGQRRPTC